MQTISLHNLLLPDKWQADAICELKEGRDVVIDAPTGAGKTYVFEKFIESTNLHRQAVYTVPTRALANDKYAEWKQKGWRVGIATGDVSIDTEAPILVATLEAVQCMVNRPPHPSIVVIDEYQWIQDPLRGSHYEGFIVALPPDVQLLLLSGCVANPGDIVEWMGRLGRQGVAIRHKERPVPIEEVDVDSLSRRVHSGIEGFWARRVMAALKEDFGPVLIFAPHRQDAERLARQLARELPAPAPLNLTPEQQAILTPELSRLIGLRVAYHHSGLEYVQRAGVIEPLAKAGQLRAVVATLGLSAGINFSLRSVMITASRYSVEGMDRDIQSHELLQMIGRAGRRGLDEIGYLLVSERSPRMGQARPLNLRRSQAIPWSALLSKASIHDDIKIHALEFGKKLFSEEPLKMGIEASISRSSSEFPCIQRTDTGRARLVKRTKRIFKGCKTCPLREECLALDQKPTLLWQWVRLGLLTENLELTLRGSMVSGFLGAEGLAIAAAVEDEAYDIKEIVYDVANLFAGERFCKEEARWSGALAFACQKAYGRFSIDGYLQWGIPIQYGTGASDLIRRILGKDKRRSQMTTDYAGMGDIDRLMTEWRSILKQIVQAEALEHPRWLELQKEAAECLAVFPAPPMPDFPRLTAEQSRSVSHRVMFKG